MKYCTGSICTDSEQKTMVMHEKSKFEPNVKLKLIRKKSKDKAVVTDPDSAARIMREMIINDREEFRILHLDTRHNVVGIETSSIGALDYAIVTQRETFKGAMKNNAQAIIVGHNHPSGNPMPSNEDIQVCKLLRQGGEILGIPILDCLVIGEGNSFTSIVKQENL